MKVIMAPSTKDKQIIMPWIVEELIAGYHLIEIKEQEQFKQIEGEIEPDFEVQLGEQQVEWVEELRELSLLFVTIGDKQNSKKVGCYYEMTKGSWEKESELLKQQSLWMSCYSNNQVFSSHLIKTIQAVLEKAKQLRKRAVIYLDGMPKERYFCHRSLTYKLINELIGEEHLILQVMQKEDQVACYLMSERSYEPYKNRFLYGRSYHKLIGRVIKQLTRQNEDRVTNPLYDDFFYERLLMTEKLYVPLMNGWQNEANRLVDLAKVSLGKGQYAIYDTKSHIEKQKDYLRAYIPMQWTLPLAAQIPLHRKQGYGKGDHNPLKGTFNYKGKDVYVGIVTGEAIAFWDPFLRTAKGKSRISCIWEQEEADQGVYYTGSSIDKLLAQEKTCHYEKSDATYLLEIAGGKYAQEEAIASEATFLVAKIRPASREIQAVYRGEVQPSTVLVPDLLIAAQKLLELAKLNQKPLVLYLPYFYLLEGEEGKNSYDRLFDELSYEPGLTIIMPTGEEADKRHKQFIEGEATETFIETKQDEQTIVGVICSEKLAAFTAMLQLAGDNEQKVYLEQKGTYKTKVGSVETSGIIWDATSGALTLRFQISQQLKSKWRLTFKSEDNEPLKLSISLREMALGLDATLEAYSVLATANMAPSKWSTIGVGSFDTSHLAVIGGSGRTGSGCKERLTLVAEGRHVTWDSRTHERCIVEGSAASASLVTGVVAALYSKWQSEKGRPYPNTHMMKAWLESMLIRMPQQNYPHLSQGNGILGVKQLEATLMAPLE